MCSSDLCFQNIESQLQGKRAEVFLTGALTHVDRCENERDLCWRMNAEGPGVVAEECARLGYKLTHFSTEYVFGQAEYEGGAVGPFSEEGPTIEKLHKFIHSNGYERSGKHHEIYLSDINRTAPEKWKTIIRQAVKGVPPSARG